MPRVPRTPRLGEGVSEAALPGVRLNTNAPIEAFGGGQEKVYQAAQGVLGTAQKIFEKEAELADDARTKDYYSKLNRAKNEMLYGSNDGKTPGALARQGQDSFGVMDELGPRFDKLADDYEAELSSDRQRAGAREIRNRERVSLDDTLQKHVFNEGEKFKDDADNSAISATRQDITFNYHDPKAVEMGLDRVKALVLSRAERKGRGGDQDYVTAEMAKEVGATHLEVMKRMLANNEDQAAKSYYEQDFVKEYMDAKDLATADNLVKTGSNLGESQRMVDNLTSKYPDDYKKQQEEIYKIDDNPELRKLALQELGSRHSEMKSAKTEYNENNFTAVSDTIWQTKSIPKDKFALLSPQDKIHALEQLKRATEGIQPGRNSQKYMDTMEMAINPKFQKAFLQMSLSRLKGEVTDEELDRLTAIRKDLLSGKSSKDLDDYRTEKAIVDETAGSIKIGASAKDGTAKQKEYKAFTDRVALEQSSEQRRLGRPLSKSELQAIADSNAKSVLVERGMFFNTRKKVYDMAIGDVPSAARKELEARLRAGKKPVTDANILYLFTKENIEKD